MKLPKIVVFDVGGTLLEGNNSFNIEAGYQYLYDEVFDVKESFEDYMEFIRGVLPIIKQRESCDLEFSFSAFFNYLQVVYGLKTNKKYSEIEIEFVSKFYQTKLIPNVINLLDYLKSQNVLLYVLSNSMYSTGEIIYELTENKINEYFLEVVSSGDHLLRKPSLDLFKMYLKKFSIMGYQPWEVCYIGNMYYYDIESPVKLGMQAVLKGDNNLIKDGYIEINNYLTLIEMWKENE